MSESIQTLYRDSQTAVRASFGSDSSRALDYYRPFLEFVSGVRLPGAPAGATELLDVGCGTGWSTFGFANVGYRASGIDLNPSAFEPPPHVRCTLQYGSATDIPYPAESFDVVACHQCLEHVPEPRRALDEMARVCRPNGVITVVGPNLVSPLTGLAYAARPSSWRTLRLRRRPGMPRHPYGNTLPETLALSVVRGLQLLAKLVRRSPRFTMRQPDQVPPFHADNDACYLCNPTDLVSYFKKNGFRIERRGKPGRLPLTYLIAGGTWVAARKRLER